MFLLNSRLFWRKLTESHSMNTLIKCFLHHNWYIHNAQFIKFSTEIHFILLENIKKSVKHIFPRHLAFSIKIRNFCSKMPFLITNVFLTFDTYIICIFFLISIWYLLFQIIVASIWTGRSNWVHRTVHPRAEKCAIKEFDICLSFLSF